LTNAGITNLALRCPKLKKLYLPGTSGLGDESLLTLLENCPELNHMEITSTGRGNSMFSNAAFETIQQHPEWATKLKKLRISARPFAKPLKELSKERPALAFELVSTTEEKKWSDWELEESFVTYKAGKKAKNANPTI
jgi:hypothetical protein